MTFDKKKREKLREAYLKAATSKKNIFTFEKKKFVTAYAGYLLQHLDNVLR